MADPRTLVPRLFLAVVRPFRQFFRLQAAGGITLVLNTVLALWWANSRFAESYQDLLHTTVNLSFAHYGLAWPLHHFTNDALMSVFFLVVGMEIKRELLVGELRTVRRALLPALAALGGMLVPAAIHFAFNRGTPAQPGWGIPMATDIAFALGCLALVSSRVPSSLVVFLMALAIFDDLGAIVVIALFYGSGVKLGALALALGITLVLVAMLKLGVTRVWPYVVLGIPLWVATLESGIHATIAGVVLGLCIPARSARRPSEVLAELERAVTRLRRSKESELDASGPLAALERHLESMQPPLDRMVHGLHPWVAFGIVPVFVICNAGVQLSGDLGAIAFSSPALGVALGLLVGKTVGVFGVTWLAVRTGLAPKPTGASFQQIFGVSILAGIGFTMSIFVATLAYPGQDELLSSAKVGIFAGSLLSVMLGLSVLIWVGKRTLAHQQAEPEDDLAVDLSVPQFAEGFLVEPWVARGDLVGKTLAQAELRSRLGLSVLGVHPGGRGSVVDRGLLPVGPDYVIAQGDTLLLVGAREAVERLVKASAHGSDPSLVD